MTKGIFIPLETSEDKIEAIKGALESQDVPFTEIGEAKSNIKLLPRLANGQISTVFVANGRNYTFINPKDGIGIARYTTMSQLLIPFMNGKRSYEEIQKYWFDVVPEVMGVQVEDNPTNALRKCQHIIAQRIYAFTDAMGDISKERYDISMFICAVFIIRDGEDLRRYSFSEAESKIEDWIEEGYNPHDFFGIASSLSNTFRAEFEARKEAAKRQMELSMSLGNTE